MCHFLSAVLTQDGRLFCDPEHTDSHSDLIAAHGIKEREVPGIAQKFVRLELLPDAEWSSPDKWSERVDEPEVPAWFGADERTKAFAQMRAIAQAMFLVDAERPMLLGGCWILKGKTVVFDAKSSRVVSMSGTSSVVSMSGTSSVGSMSGTSSVGSMSGTSSVGSMYDTSSVGSMYDTSRVGSMYGTSRVGSMYDTSRVGSMYDTSSVPLSRSPDRDYRIKREEVVAVKAAKKAKKTAKKTAKRRAKK